MEETLKFIELRLSPLNLQQQTLRAVLNPACQLELLRKPEDKRPETDPLDDTGYFYSETLDRNS